MKTTKEIITFSLVVVFSMLISSCNDDEISTIDTLKTTLPEALEQSLIESNLPYELDGAGGAFHPQQLTIKFRDGVDQSTRNDILINRLGAVSIQECMCGDVLTLSTWDENGLNERGGLEGVKQKGEDENEIEEVSFNYYNYTDELTLNPPTIFGNPQETDLEGQNVIAVLDVGLDYGGNTAFENKLQGNSNEIENGADDDVPANCLVDDFIGWDFANDDNDPSDDHGHGTHVTNIISDQLFVVDPSGILTESTSFLPIKTHNKNGIGTLFNVSCGIIYAATRNADVINASWGFYSKEMPEVLRSAIEFANILSGTILVASAGNEGINLDTRNHYPSDFAADFDYVISVGASDREQASIADFSNYYTSESSNLLAPGVDISATMPIWYTPSPDIKSGTSMAAAAVTAAVADVINKCGTNDGNAIVNSIKANLITNNTSIGTDNINYVNYIPHDTIPCP